MSAGQQGVTLEVSCCRIDDAADNHLLNQTSRDIYGTVDESLFVLLASYSSPLLVVAMDKPELLERLEAPASLVL